MLDDIVNSVKSIPRILLLAAMGIIYGCRHDNYIGLPYQGIYRWKATALVQTDGTNPDSIVPFVLYETNAGDHRTDAEEFWREPLATGTTEKLAQDVLPIQNAFMLDRYTTQVPPDYRDGDPSNGEAKRFQMQVQQ